MYNLHEKVILTDVDGVLLDWEYSFTMWMQRHGFERNKGSEILYTIFNRYNLNQDEALRYIRMFNESAAIGFLPPMRDAIKYVRKLHEEHGYIFHAITSLGLDPSSYELRKRNLETVFGKGVFEKVVCVDTGACKRNALLPYTDSECLWVEDKPENADVGVELGLKSVLVSHPYNQSYKGLATVVNTWKDIYYYQTAGGIN